MVYNVDIKERRKSMKPTIKELWLEYQQEKNSTLTQEQKEISQRLYDISEELTASFNKRQS